MIWRHASRTRSCPAIQVTALQPRLAGRRRRGGGVRLLLSPASAPRWSTRSPTATCRSCRALTMLVAGRLVVLNLVADLATILVTPRLRTRRDERRRSHRAPPGSPVERAPPARRRGPASAPGRAPAHALRWRTRIGLALVLVRGRRRGVRPAARAALARPRSSARRTAGPSAGARSAPTRSAATCSAASSTAAARSSWLSAAATLFGRRPRRRRSASSRRTARLARRRADARDGRLLAFPQIVLVLLAVAGVGPKLWLIVLAVGLTHRRASRG